MLAMLEIGHHTVEAFAGGNHLWRVGSSAAVALGLSDVGLEIQGKIGLLSLDNEPRPDGLEEALCSTGGSHPAIERAMLSARPLSGVYGATERVSDAAEGPGVGHVHPEVEGVDRVLGSRDPLIRPAPGDSDTALSVEETSDVSVGFFVVHGSDSLPCAHIRVKYENYDENSVNSVDTLTDDAEGNTEPSPRKGEGVETMRGAREGRYGPASWETMRGGRDDRPPASAGHQVTERNSKYLKLRPHTDCAGKFLTWKGKPVDQVADTHIAWIMFALTCSRRSTLGKQTGKT